jgi:hypothetical protein
MASLMGLSIELKLSVVEFLDAEKMGDSEHDDYERDLYDNREDDDSQRRLPKANSSLVNLSRVNRLFRGIVAPFLFNTVILRNTKVSAQSIRTLANGPHASLVKRLEYLAVVPLHADGPYGITIKPKAEDFPDEVEEALVNLGRFEKLETVGVEFPWDEEGWSEKFIDLLDEETREDVLKQETDWNWRALMNKSYTALIRNEPGVVKKLELRNLIPGEASVWRTQEWWSYLRKLEGFKISLRGNHDDSLSTQPGYTDFVAAFHNLFIDHLDEVRDFSFSSSKGGIVSTSEI